ncbi:MAG: L-histidine N(alpha)-methyltransferase [Planctomycetia bacterium]
MGDDFVDAVRVGLARSPKEIPCRFFYDEVGSELFEKICGLPEYYLTRAERSILQRYADEIAAGFDAPPALVELGSGSSVKTRLLIEAMLNRFDAVEYVPIDISRSIMVDSCDQLLEDYPGLTATAVHAEYQDGLRIAAEKVCGPKMIVWLGSNIGNFERTDARRFLRMVRGSVSPGDAVLVGADLRKDAAVLEAAYDDAAGVTAAFNKNLLVRINRELAGGFDLDAIDHPARFDPVAGCIEMSLVSRKKQTIAIDGLKTSVGFEAGESIRTERCHKYTLDQIEELSEAAGFKAASCWMDAERRFSVNLLTPV